MAMTKFLAASLLGVMSLTSGAIAQGHPGLPTHFRDGTPIPSINRGGSSGGSGGKPPSSPPPPHRSSGGSFSSSGGSSSGSTQVNTSSAKCTAIAFGGSDVDTTNARAEAAADAKKYICAGGSSGVAYDVAYATASAFATAIAKASVACEATGDTTIQADAYAKAVAEANVWLEAYAQAVASAGDCENCEAYAESWGYIAKDVFLSAVADAKVSVDAITTSDAPGTLIIKVTDFEKEVAEATATAYAEAIAGASNYYNSNKCVAWVLTEGCVDDDCFQCEAHSASESAIKEIDAIAEAGANAVGYVCGEDAIAYADTQVTAKALAEATAIAVSFVYASCETDEGGYACAAADTFISASAHAVAVAFADAAALGLNCEDTCTVDVSAGVSALGEILVTAATDAYATVCVEDGAAWTVGDLQVSIESGYLEAIAEAVAFVFVSNHPQVCAAGVTVDTYVGP